MADKHTDKPPEPMVRFGNQWIPAHDIWKKMETANVVANAIERFNSNFPGLSSSETRDVVPLVRQRLKNIELKMPDKDRAAPDHAALCAGLLDQLSPEEALQVLEQEHGLKLDIMDLVQCAGEQAYARRMQQEATEFAENRISPEQTAQLWNDAHRPAPGGGLWTAHTVKLLVDGKS